MQNLWMVGIMMAALVGSGAVVGMGAYNDHDDMHSRMHGDHDDEYHEHEDCEEYSDEECFEEHEECDHHHENGHHDDHECWE